MESSLNTRRTDPHDVNPGPSTQAELVSRADERLVHAYAQIARADEQLARVNEQLSKLEYDARPKKSANRSSVIAWQAGATRLRRHAVDSGHLYCCFRLAVLWRDSQADDFPVGTATGCGFAVAGGNTEARRPAEPACRTGGCG